jgi:hypothetical protein
MTDNLENEPLALSSLMAPSREVCTIVCIHDTWHHRAISYFCAVLRMLLVISRRTLLVITLIVGVLSSIVTSFLLVHLQQTATAPWCQSSSSLRLLTISNIDDNMSSTADDSGASMIIDKTVYSLQDIIGTDAGGRGMKSLICSGDLLQASTVLANISSSTHVLVLSGFPCCVNEAPPTETDGPPGAVALARAAHALGAKHVTLVTDDCNQDVFEAALDTLLLKENISMETFPGIMTPDDEDRLQVLANSSDLVLACERAGPAQDGHCYTMRGIDMTERGLIAPLHKLIVEGNLLIVIGDGGNELGMGKVYSEIVNNPNISNGQQIACVTKADYLIAASVSNWGGYALATGAALIKAKLDNDKTTPLNQRIASWIEKCIPTEQEEVALLNRCIAKGCRDGVSGKVEATVDGMPLETSMECLRAIRETSLGVCNEISSIL